MGKLFFLTEEVWGSLSLAAQEELLSAQGVVVPIRATIVLMEDGRKVIKYFDHGRVINEGELVDYYDTPLTKERGCTTAVQCLDDCSYIKVDGNLPPPRDYTNIWTKGAADMSSTNKEG